MNFSREVGECFTLSWACLAFCLLSRSRGMEKETEGTLDTQSTWTWRVGHTLAPAPSLLSSGPSNTGAPQY